MSCCVDGCDSTDLSKSQAKKPAAVRRCKVHVADNIAPPEPPGSVQRGTGNKRFKREDNAELLSAFARRESSGIDTSRRYKVRGVKEPRRSPWGLATKEEQKVGIALKADFEDWCGLHQSHAAFQRKLHAELRAEVDAPWPPNTEPAARQRHSRKVALAVGDLELLAQSEARLKKLPHLSKPDQGFMDARARGFLTTLRGKDLQHGDSEVLPMESTGKGTKNCAVPWGHGQVTAAPFISPYAELHFTSGTGASGWSVTQFHEAFVASAPDGGIIASAESPIKRVDSAADSAADSTATEEMKEESHKPPELNPLSESETATANSTTNDWWLCGLKIPRCDRLTMAVLLELGDINLRMEQIGTKILHRGDGCAAIFCHFKANALKLDEFTQISMPHAVGDVTKDTEANYDELMKSRTAMGIYEELQAVYRNYIHPIVRKYLFAEFRLVERWMKRKDVSFFAFQVCGVTFGTVFWPVSHVDHDIFFTVLVVLEAGHYTFQDPPLGVHTGGHFVFPCQGAGFSLVPGDIIVYSPVVPHGTTEFGAPRIGVLREKCYPFRRVHAENVYKVMAAFYVKADIVKGVGTGRAVAAAHGL